MDDPTINFSWFYFIGVKKLGLSLKEVGRLTLRTFNKLYQCYKDNFDLELRLKNSNTTYKELKEISSEEEEWF